MISRFNERYCEYCIAMNPESCLIVRIEKIYSNVEAFCTICINEYANKRSRRRKTIAISGLPMEMLLRGRRRMVSTARVCLTDLSLPGPLKGTHAIAECLSARKGSKAHFLAPPAAKNTDRGLETRYYLFH